MQVEEALKILGLIAGAITSMGVVFGFIYKNLHKLISMTVSDAIDPIKIQLSRVEDKIDNNDLERCKSDLMLYINSYNAAGYMTDIQYEHMFKVYDYYRNELHGNSYIKNEMEKIIEKENQKWHNIMDQ